MRDISLCCSWWHDTFSSQIWLYARCMRVCIGMLHLISIEVNEKERRIVIFKESIENTQTNEIWKKVTETDKTCTTSICVCSRWWWWWWDSKGITSTNNNNNNNLNKQKLQLWAKNKAALVVLLVVVTFCHVSLGVLSVIQLWLKFTAEWT